MKELSSKRHFTSDNNSGVIPEAWLAMQQVNVGHHHAYGGDDVTEETLSLFKKEFGPESQTFFVFNGTAANVLAAQALCKSYEAIICSSQSHLQNDECGAPEKFTGCKLLLVPTEDGKIRVEQLQDFLTRRGDQHHSQPKVLSITQPILVWIFCLLVEPKMVYFWQKL